MCYISITIVPGRLNKQRPVYWARELIKVVDGWQRHPEWKWKGPVSGGIRLSGKIRNINLKGDKIIGVP